MPDYYSVLARAVAAKPSATADQRRAMYDVARNALIGQLRAHDPPADEEDVRRESASLDDAVERLEAELAARQPATPIAPRPAEPPPDAVSPTPQPGATAVPRQAPPLPPRPPSAARPTDIPASASAGPATRPSMPRPLPPRPMPRPPAPVGPPAMPASVTPAPVAAAPVAAPMPPVAAPTPLAAPVAPPPSAISVTPAVATAPAKSDAQAPAASAAPAPDRPAAPPIAPPSRVAPMASTAPVVTAPPRREPTFVPAMHASGDAKVSTAEIAIVPLGPPDGLGPAPRRVGFLQRFGQARSRAESGAQAEAEGAPAFDPTETAPPLRRGRSVSAEAPSRPAAPRPPRSRASGLRTGIILVVAAIVVCGVAAMAYLLRDRPEDIARLRPVAPVVPIPAPTGKVVDRVGGTPASSAPSAPATSAAPAVTAPQNAAPPTTAAQAAAPQTTAPPSTGPQTTAPQATAPANPPSSASAPDATLPIAQRAALLLQTNDTPPQVQTFTATVVWRLDTASRGPGQPLATILRADVDIPDAKLKASFAMQKNTDPAFVASHTIEIRFQPAAGSPIVSVAQIDMPAMRNEVEPTGEPLGGVTQTVQPNYFVVALSQSDPIQARNLDLLRARNWIDVQFRLDSGRLGKLTFEKGNPGDRALSDALQAWSR